jgi:hypothetical protein
VFEEGLPGSSFSFGFNDLPTIPASWTSAVHRSAGVDAGQMFDFGHFMFESLHCLNRSAHGKKDLLTHNTAFTEEGFT